MSTRDVISIMLQFGLLIIAAMSLVVTIMKHWFDIHDKKK